MAGHVESHEAMQELLTGRVVGEQGVSADMVPVSGCTETRGGTGKGERRGSSALHGSPGLHQYPPPPPTAALTAGSPGEEGSHPLPSSHWQSPGTAGRRASAPLDPQLHI